MITTGLGTTELSGTNNYSGGTTIEEGTLEVTNADALGSGTISVTPSASASAILDISSLTTYLANTNTITLNSGNTSSAAELIAANTYNLANALFLQGTNNTVSITSGDITENNLVSGTGSLTMSGAGTLTLGNNSNSYSGATLVNSGILSIAAQGGLGGTTSTTVENGATLDLAFSSGTLANTAGLTLNGGVSTTPELTFSGNNITLNNPIVLAGTSSTVYIAGSGTGTETLGRAITDSGNSATPNSLNIDLSAASVSLPKITLQSGASLAVTTAGEITQTGGINSTNLQTSSVTGTLLNGANTVSNFAGTNSTSGDIQLTNTAPLLTLGTITNSGSGNITILNTGNITFSGVVGGTSITAVGDVLTLDTNSSLNMSGSGNAIVLSAQQFINTSSEGANALSTPGGDFQIWSSNLTPFATNGSGDELGGLLANYIQYKATYGSSTVLGTGNGLLYTLAPTITAVD